MANIARAETTHDLGRYVDVQFIDQRSGEAADAQRAACTDVEDFLHGLVALPRKQAGLHSADYVRHNQCRALRNSRRQRK